MSLNTTRAIDAQEWLSSLQEAVAALRRPRVRATPSGPRSGRSGTGRGRTTHREDAASDARRPSGERGPGGLMEAARLEQAANPLAERSTQASLPERRPDGVAALRRPGRSPHQVLVFGSGVLEGWGLGNHEVGLPGAIADGLTHRSGRGVDLTVVVDPDPYGDRALEALPGLRLNRFGALIVVLGDNPAVTLTSPTAWKDSISELLTALVAHAGDGARIFIYDSSRAMLTHTGHYSNRVWRRAARHLATTAKAAARSGVRFAELAPSLHRIGSGGRFSPTAYQSWGEQIVDRMRLAQLETDEWTTPRPAPGDTADEERRQQALQSLRLRGATSSPMLNAIVKRAKAVFGADDAALNIIDGDQQWQLATTGRHGTTIPRQDDFCDVTIVTDGLTLINDTHRDPRVAGRPRAQAGSGVRFYAGVPIHTWDGYRIGALCIYSSTPRAMRGTELQELTDLAGRIEQELWTDALHRT